MASNRYLPEVIAKLCNSKPVHEENGLSVYQLKPSVRKKDEVKRLQVLTIGCVNERPIHSVLLLGETGTGKTRLINTLINRIFGVQLEDSFRLELKDQVAGEKARKQTYSQTDYITAYVIYRQDWMSHGSNYMIIDTPGFNDTRGQHHQQAMIERLRIFLMEESDIDSLNCIGLMMKASENRELKVQQEVLSSMTELLGNDVASITRLLVTFASEGTTADIIARSAGIQFTHMHCFDNWPLYIPHQVNAELTQRQLENLNYRWQNMADQCTIFLDNLKYIQPISLKKTRKLIKERQILEERLKALSSGVETVDNIIKNMKKQKMNQNQYEELASQIKWKKSIPRILREAYKVMKGYHVHNCDVCDQTCIFPCEDLSKIPHSVMGAVAGAAAVGAAAGAAAGPPGAALGAILGGAGAGTGTYMLTKRECKYGMKGVICCEDGCMHDLSEHSVGTERVVRCQVDDEVVDFDEKRRYDEIKVKIKDLEEKLGWENIRLQDATENLNADLKSLILSAKIIEELSFNSQLVDPLDLIDKLAKKTDNIRHVELYDMLRNAAKVMVTGSSERDNGTFWGNCDSVF